MDNRIELRHLLAFQVIATEGSIKRAAALLGMSQPGLSRLIARLEQRLGARLLDRGASGVTATPGGEALLARTAAIQELLHDLPQAVADAVPAARTLRLGCYDNDTPRFLTRLADTLPWLTVRARAGWAETLLPMLGRGELDAAVAWDIPEDRYRPHPDISIGVVTDEPTWLAVPVTHRFAHRDAVAMKELTDEDWILAESPALQRLVMSGCAAAGFLPRIRHVIGNVTTMRRLIRDGHGVTLAAPTVPDDVAAEGGLRIVPVIDAPHRRVFLAWSRRRVSISTAQALLKLARDHYLACAEQAAHYTALIHAHPDRFPHLLHEQSARPAVKGDVTDSK